MVQGNARPSAQQDGHIEGTRGTSTPTFWTGCTVPPTFQVKNFLPSEAICGDQITLKPFSLVSSCLVSVLKHAKFAGGLAGLSPQKLTRLYFFLLTCAINNSAKA